MSSTGVLRGLNTVAIADRCVSPERKETGPREVETARLSLYSVLVLVRQVARRF